MRALAASIREFGFTSGGQLSCIYCTLTTRGCWGPRPKHFVLAGPLCLKGRLNSLSQDTIAVRFNAADRPQDIRLPKRRYFITWSLGKRGIYLYELCEPIGGSWQARDGGDHYRDIFPHVALRLHPCRGRPTVTFSSPPRSLPGAQWSSSHPITMRRRSRLPCASDQPATTMHGKSTSPSFWTRPWPAIMPLALSSRIGLVNPNSRINDLVYLLCRMHAGNFSRKAVEVSGPEGSPVPLAASIMTPEEFEEIARRIAAET
jgi:hypothetical protein